MEHNKINYQVIEDCLLAAESMDYIEAIFKASATGVLDSELFCLKGDNLRSPPRSASRMIRL